MDSLGTFLLILLGLLFNPLVWLIIIIALVVRHNRKNPKTSDSSARLSINPETLPTTNQYHSESDISELLEDMAHNTKDQVERDVLERAAYSARLGLHYLVSRATYRKQFGQTPIPTPTTSFAEHAPSAPHRAQATPPPSKPAGPPPEPLAERGLKALQNINILLYLGAFFVVIAAGIFVGSTYQSIGPGGQVFVLGLFTAAFYLTGLALYKFTDRIKPAGVTFTAIGLLLGPLVGVAAQSLLFAGKNVGPVWLVTSVVLLAMQVVAFLVIRKTYIAYFAALTTISLFQSVIATSNANLYWYGWVMLIIAMGYAVIGKYIGDKQVAEPLTVTAQVFVPISIVLSLVSISNFGYWHVGVQLILAATFYLVCMALRDFDDSQETQIYLWLAASLFPIGLGLTLYARQIPAVGVFAILWVIAISYVLAEKFALHDRHQIVYEWISGICMVIAPLLLLGHGGALAWVVLAATLFHAIHYVITRKALSYSLFLPTLSVLPWLFASLAFNPTLQPNQIGTIYVIMGLIAAPIAQFIWKPKHPRYADLTRGFVLVWAILGTLVAYVSGSTLWPTALGSLTGGIALFFALTGESALVALTAGAWNAALVTLGLHFGWTPGWMAGGIMVISLVMYGLKWLPQLKEQARDMSWLGIINLIFAFGWAAQANIAPGRVMMAVIAVAIMAIAIYEELLIGFGLGSLMLYGAVIALGMTINLSQTWIFVLVLAVAALIYSTKHIRDSFKKDAAGVALLYGLGLGYAYFGAFMNATWGNLTVIVAVIGALFALSYLEDERIGSATAYLAVLGGGIALANVAGWWISPTVLVSALVLYGAGSLSAKDSDRTKLARWIGLLGTYLTLLTNSSNSLPSWLPIVQNYTAGALTLAESYRMQYRPGKYVGSAIIWLVTLQAYGAASVANTQVYMQTTAAYFAALAYRQYQRGDKQPQDILTATALGFATLPLAVQALNDQTGGYVLGILALGIVILLIGLASHYALVRTWGIATLVIITLYKTAGAILNLPAWVWFGVIGLTILAGAIYLLSRRHE